MYIKIMLILGAFIFMLQSTKFVSKALGIKLDEMSFLSSARAGLGLMAAAGATAVGVGAGVVGAVKKSRKDGSNALGTLGHGVLGGFQGMVRSGGAAFGGATKSIISGKDSAGKTFHDIMDQSKKARENLEILQESGADVKFEPFLRIKYEDLNKKLEENKNINKKANDLKKLAEDEALKDTDITADAVTSNGNRYKLNYNALLSVFQSTADGASGVVNGQTITKNEMAEILNSSKFKDNMTQEFMSNGGNPLVQQSIKEINHDLQQVYGADAYQIDGSSASFVSDVKNVRNTAGANASSIQFGGSISNMTNSNYDRASSSFKSSGSISARAYDQAKSANQTGSNPSGKK